MPNSKLFRTHPVILQDSGWALLKENLSEAKGHQSQQHDCHPTAPFIINAQCRFALLECVWLKVESIRHSFICLCFSLSLSTALSSEFFFLLFLYSIYFFLLIFLYMSAFLLHCFLLLFTKLSVMTSFSLSLSVSVFLLLSLSVSIYLCSGSGSLADSSLFHILLSLSPASSCDFFLFILIRNIYLFTSLIPYVCLFTK